MLQVFRSSGKDASNPEFADALAATKRDPQLGEWFDDQREFDASVSRTLRDQPVPLGLRARLLATWNLVVPVPWWHQPAWIGLAACLIGLLVLTAATLKPAQFQDVREHMVNRAWDVNDHLKFSASDLSEIRQWLRKEGACADFKLPEALRELPISGCRILEWRGRRIPFLCLGGGFEHKHLFIIDQLEFPNLPTEQSPQFADCGGWPTVSWRTGNKTYIMCGMKNMTVVRRFRSNQQWAWN